MTPEYLGQKDSEHMQQAALFCWANMAMKRGLNEADDMRQYSISIANEMNCPLAVPELKWLHAIPNAGARGNKVAAGQLKAEGVKAGVADTFLPVRRLSAIDNFIVPGIYIELKRKNGKPSDVTKEQQEFRDFVRSQGYVWIVCFGWRHAADMLKLYLNQNKS